MKRRKTRFNKIKVTGANSVNFINNCMCAGLNLRNIDRTSNNETIFDINDKDYRLLTKIDNRGCVVEIVEIGGKKKLIDKLMYRSGLIIGLIISFVAIMFINNRLLQIHINGLISTSRESVLESLEEYGVSRFSYMNYDLKSIENKLAEKFDFSLVSIITKGNSIILSIKEELPSIEDTYVAVTADYNMVIKSIKVFAGTQKVKSGDIVYKGDILVEPYVKSGDSIVYVTPCAEIIAEVYFSNSYVFKNTEEINIRTGKKQIVESKIQLGSWVIHEQSKDSSYSEYEIVNTNINLSKYFLPIIINKTYTYETTKTKITRAFEEEKEEIIDNQKKQLYSEISDRFKVENENIDIIPIADGYIVNIHLTSIINLKYS